MNNRTRERSPHIGIFGLRNAGKSSLINAMAGQEVAIVSETPGTTTDPVRKTIEVPGFGPVVFIDTAGFDDEGMLGDKRKKRSEDVLQQIDFAFILVVNNSLQTIEKQWIEAMIAADIPFAILHNKSDLHPLQPDFTMQMERDFDSTPMAFSTVKNPDIDGLTALMKKGIPETAHTAGMLIGDLISYGDVVLLITPIDIEAPEGRMILPQVQVIRDVLDHDGIAVVCKEREVDAYIRRMQPMPRLVITDSQVFPKADAAIPPEIMLTSFSILLARQKGDFQHYLQGTPHISLLKDGDKILILESCTHHVSCDDIGRMKLPRWISQFTGKSLTYEVVAGLSPLPDDLKTFAMVIQCGGCVITRRQVLNRIRPAVNAGIPVTNYGMAIAWVHGIYQRAVAPFTGNDPASADYL